MTKSSDRFDNVYDGEDANEVLTIRMTRRQWWHLDDWRAEMPDRYPNRAAERKAGWKAIDEAKAEPTPGKKGAEP